MDTTYAPHGWKKAVLIICSVMMILTAAFSVVVALAAALMTGSSELAASFQDAMAGNFLGLIMGGLSSKDMLLVVAAIFFTSGFFDLLCGIFGIRSARGTMVIMPYLVMATISLAVSVITFAVDTATGSAALDPANLIGSMAFPAVAAGVGLLVWREERAA